MDEPAELNGLPQGRVISGSDLLVSASDLQLIYGVKQQETHEEPTQQQGLPGLPGSPDVKVEGGDRGMVLEYVYNGSQDQQLSDANHLDTESHMNPPTHMVTEASSQNDTDMNRMASINTVTLASTDYSGSPQNNLKPSRLSSANTSQSGGQVAMGVRLALAKQLSDKNIISTAITQTAELEKKTRLLGKRYKSFDDFKTNCLDYLTSQGHRFIRRTSVSIAYRNKSNKKVQFPNCLKFGTVTYTCIHAGTWKKTGSIRQTSSLKKGCGAYIHLRAVRLHDNSAVLQINNYNIEHNHVLIKPNAGVYAWDRRLHKDEKEIVEALLEGGVSHSEIQDFVQEKYDKTLQNRVLFDLEKSLKERSAAKLPRSSAEQLELTIRASDILNDHKLTYSNKGSDPQTVKERSAVGESILKELRQKCYKPKMKEVKPILTHMQNYLTHVACRRFMNETDNIMSQSRGGVAVNVDRDGVTMITTSFDHKYLIQDDVCSCRKIRTEFPCWHLIMYFYKFKKDLRTIIPEKYHKQNISSYHEEADFKDIIVEPEDNEYERENRVNFSFDGEDNVSHFVDSEDVEDSKEDQTKEIDVFDDLVSIFYQNKEKQPERLRILNKIIEKWKAENEAQSNQCVLLVPEKKKRGRKRKQDSELASSYQKFSQKKVKIPRKTIVLKMKKEKTDNDDPNILIKSKNSVTEGGITTLSIESLVQPMTIDTDSSSNELLRAKEGILGNKGGKTINIVDAGGSKVVLLAPIKKNSKTDPT